jgi:hypothetical protein
MIPSTRCLPADDENAVTTVRKKFRPFLRLRWLTVPVLLAAICVVACSGQPLEPWHTERLSAEFTASDADEITTLDDYLALEEQLFAELHDDVYSEVPTGPEFALFRYSRGSLADPDMRTPNFNRTFELRADDPQGGVLLLHGLTDSPYSLRALGQKLNEQGFWVVGLRLPGHGTAPSALKVRTLAGHGRGDAYRNATSQHKGRRQAYPYCGLFERCRTRDRSRHRVI